jgi:hypothetical protein
LASPQRKNRLVTRMNASVYDLPVDGVVVFNYVGIFAKNIF